MCDPTNPRHVEREIEDVCRSVAMQLDCDAHQLTNDVVAVLVATALKNPGIADPQRYLRRSARRAAYRICRQNRHKWRQFESENAAEGVDQRPSVIEQLIKNEEREMVERAIQQLEPDERRAIDRFRRTADSGMRKEDYYLKQRAIRKIREIIGWSAN